MASQVESAAVGGMVACSLVALLVAAYSQWVATVARRRVFELEKALAAATALPPAAGAELAEYLVALAAGAEPGSLQHLVLQSATALAAERQRVDELLTDLVSAVMAAARGEVPAWSAGCRSGRTADGRAVCGVQAGPQRRPVAGGGRDARR